MQPTSRPFTTARFVLGVLGAVLIMASGVIHSVLGWPGVQQAMRRGGASRDVVAGLIVPWHLAGLAMVTFGAITIMSLISMRRGLAGARSAPIVVGSALTLFALCGAAFIKADATFLVFLVPGLLILAAAL